MGTPPVKSSPLPSAATAATGATSATVSVSSGGLTGNRLVIHVSDNKVALPPVITDGNYEDVHDENIIVLKDEDNCPTQACPQSFPNDPNDDRLVTLIAAVEAYVDQDCASKDDCTISQEWGYQSTVGVLNKLIVSDKCFLASPPSTRM